MDRTTTYFEAWDDFFVWVKKQPVWENLSRQEQQYIYQTNADRKKGRRINIRIETLLTKYGAGRYEFPGRVIIHE